NGEEQWKLTRPLSQHAALIEAACFGATLQEAARHKLEADMLDAGGIGCITTCLSQAEQYHHHRSAHNSRHGQKNRCPPHQRG
ncbi:hypothetical protein QML16_29860, partial [Klebsiella pneumoniae]